MEFKSVSTKMTREEVTLLKTFCERKGVTPSSFIRKVVVKEMEIPMPQNVAGKNKLTYDKINDKFSWSVELDDGKLIEVLKEISPDFIDELNKSIKNVLKERSAFMGKRKKDSVPVPSNMLREEK